MSSKAVRRARVSVRPANAPQDGGRSKTKENCARICSSNTRACCAIFSPRAFVAENVTGLVKGAAKGYFIEIMKVLQECGYRVSCRILNAKWLGVPQDRARVFIVGMRNDLDLDPPYPAPLPYYFSIRDAIPWIDGLEYKTGARG
jgi:C-5 cytosine-specific DNA methylase